jgi:hypothetical protein
MSFPNYTAKVITIFSVVIITLLISLTPCYSYSTRNVFLVVIDGSRQTETSFDTTHQYIPHLWNDLRPLGSLNTTFSNISVTATCPGHATLETGIWQNIVNNGTVRPKQPTMFEYLRKQYGTDSSLMWVVAGKTKLNMLTHSTCAGYGTEYAASANGIDRNDDATWTALQSAMEKHPKLVMVNFASVDHSGHSSKWGEYTTAIVKVDSIINNLWSKITSDPIYRGKTTLIITNDHGRHDDAHGGFANHGDHCTGCQQLFFLAIGPDFKSNYVSNQPRYQVDVAPTIGELLGFKTPYSIGTNMSELYKKNRQKK